MSKTEHAIEGVIRTFLIPGLAALGWNQLGGADALGLPHVGFWVIFGLLLVVGAVAYEIGNSWEQGHQRAAAVARDLT